jgi:hypothetical protein
MWTQVSIYWLEVDSKRCRYFYGTEPWAWTVASKQTAHNLRKDAWMARKLRECARDFILDRNDLPINSYAMMKDWQKKPTYICKVLGKISKSRMLFISPQHPRCRNVLTELSQEPSERLESGWGLWAIVGPWIQRANIDEHERPDVVKYRQRSFGWNLRNSRSECEVGLLISCRLTMDGCDRLIEMSCQGGYLRRGRTSKGISSTRRSKSMQRGDRYIGEALPGGGARACLWQHLNSLEAPRWHTVRP